MSGLFIISIVVVYVLVMVFSLLGFRESFY